MGLGLGWGAVPDDLGRPWGRFAPCALRVCLVLIACGARRIVERYGCYVSVPSRVTSRRGGALRM